jgi:hypothetical protein
VDRATLEFLAQVALALAPPGDHPDYGTALKAAANAEIVRLDLRKRAEESLWCFRSEVLGNPVLYEPLHRPLCDMVQEPTRQLFLLAPCRSA